MNEDRIIGGEPLPVDRTESDLWSWDRGVGFMGELGTPNRGIIELYGDEHTGKTSLALYLVGKRALKSDLVFCNFEGNIDPNYLNFVTANAGHKGAIRYVIDQERKKGKAVQRPHEPMLQEAIDALRDKDVAATLVDSYGAFTSLKASTKDLGKRTVSEEARTLNDAARRVQNRIRNAEAGKWYFVINHTHPRIGGAGFNTPGGRKTKYFAIIRAWIRRKVNDWPEGTGNFVSEITFQKLKYGIKGRKCWVYFIPGFGVSREMTAVYECIEMGLAKKEATIKLYVMDGEDKKFKWMSQGRISTLAKKALKPDKNKKVFLPFFEALERYASENEF
ncbi:MAG: hypothetical protein ACE5I5_19900 [Candidatus Heimdallarchaeota archaeon]